MFLPAENSHFDGIEYLENYNIILKLFSLITLLALVIIIPTIVYIIIISITSSRCKPLKQTLLERSIPVPYDENLLPNVHPN